MQAPQVLIGSRSVELPHRVVQKLQWGSLLVIRVVPESGQRFNRNVLAFDDQGRQLWQIAESPHGDAADKPFMDLRVNQQGELIAGNWNGVEYRVHPETGALTLTGFGK